jgi:hypothetical protein
MGMKPYIVSLFWTALFSAGAWAQGVPVTLQWFETSWRTMEDRTADAFMAGYARVWTPPPSKGEGGGFSVGYNCFDRFDLGAPGSPTRYGTQADLLAVIAEQNKASIATFVDLILNHNAHSDNATPGFEGNGDYPGFVISFGGDPQGDFHPRWDDCESNPLECRIAGLIDIAHEKNHVMIRHPVTPGGPQNIPAGLTHDRPAESNRRFYPDQALPANSIGIHPFNSTDPMAGDPVAENAMGLLLRHTRWLLEVIRVDGFRIDAAKHMPSWVLRDFYDRHVWRRWGTDLNGNVTTPYCFLEVFDGNLGVQAGYVCKNGQGDCNTADGVAGNRDTLDFPLYFKLRDELNGTGLGTWENIVGASVDAIFDGNPNNGTFGVQYVQSHDQFAPAADNLAYAYLLTRTGSPIVYFQAGEFGSVDFPKGGRGDALGGQFGTLITTLVDVHNEYARGDYLERRDAGNPSFQDVLIYERSNACLVGLNDRQDGGYDQRTVATNFSPGLRLKELTGNAIDPQIDPNNDIFDVVTVGPGGVVTIRVPRNKNLNNMAHNKGYVVYGPFNPDGELTLTNVNATIPADPQGESNGTRRLTEIPVLTADSFEVRLETTDPDSTDEGEDDLAMLRIDGGMDINGNGHIDALDPAFVGYGYENFLTESHPLESGGIDIDGGQKGLYRQTIDATQLSEGRHYLSVIAFRSRPSNAPPIFETWRKVFLIDRFPAAIELVSPAPGTPITTPATTFIFRCPDRTANSVHVFVDQQPGTDVVSLATQGQNPADRIDRDEFRRVINNLSAGNHRLDLVAFEETGRAGRVTFGNVRVVINGFDGLGDMNGDGRVTNRDIFPFIQMVQAGNQFHPGGDLSGDALVDSNDVPLFADKLRGAGVPQAAVDEMIRMAGTTTETVAPEASQSEQAPGTAAPEGGA